MRKITKMKKETAKIGFLMMSSKLIISDCHATEVEWQAFATTSVTQSTNVARQKWK